MTDEQSTTETRGTDSTHDTLEPQASPGMGMATPPSEDVSADGRREEAAEGVPAAKECEGPAAEAEPAHDAEPIVEQGGEPLPEEAEPAASDSGPLPSSTEPSEAAPGTEQAVPSAEDRNEDTPAERDSESSHAEAEPDESSSDQALIESDLPDPTAADWDEDDPLGPEWEYVEPEVARDWPEEAHAEPMALEKVNTTARMPAVIDSPQANAAGADPQLSDVADTFALWLHGRIGAFGALVAQHRLATGLVALACVAAILVAVLVGLDATKVPPEEQIKSDARSLLAPPSYTVGNYASDDPLVLQAVDVASIRESEQVKGACEVEVLATFTNPGMETRADATLTYEREGDGWSCVDSSVGNASHHATAGVNQQLVVEHVASLLQKADTRSDTEGLATLYRNAHVEITHEEFSEETQTDEISLHCASGGTFVDYECDLTARFRFVPASGAWELAEASVSEGAYDLGFSPLLGTWRGTFSSQQSSSHKCLAARETGLSLTITQAATTPDGGAVVEGTLSGIAHLHTELEDDASTTEGDTTLESVPFSGTLHSTSDSDDILTLLTGTEEEAAGIVFDCTVQDVTGGSVALTLTFGQTTDPDAATATLSSTFDYRDTFLLIVPYDRQSSFADTFILQKAE